MGPHTDRQLFPGSVSEGWRLTITIFGRAHCGPASGFILLRLQNTTDESFYSFNGSFGMICVCSPVVGCADPSKAMFIYHYETMHI